MCGLFCRGKGNYRDGESITCIVFGELVMKASLADDQIECGGVCMSERPEATLISLSW